MVTHDAEAAGIADRQFKLVNGKLAENGAIVG